MRRFAVPLMAGCCLMAQTPLPRTSKDWAGYVERWRDAPHAPLTLVGSEAVLSSKARRQDDETIRLRVCGDIGWQTLSEAEWTRLMATRGATSSRWVALDPKGQVIAEGPTLARGEALLDLLRSQGQIPAWEKLERFLSENPESGDALSQRLSWSLMFAQNRFLALVDQGRAERQTPPGALLPSGRFKNADDAEVAYREASETLERLARLPDAWRFQDFQLLALVLQQFDGAASGRLRAALGLMADITLEAWQRHPRSGGLDAFKNGLGLDGLGAFWFACASAAQGKTPMPPRLTAAPDQAWAPEDLVLFATFCLKLSGHCDALLAFVDALPMPDLTQIKRAEDRKAAQQYLELCQLTRISALGTLGRWGEATEILQEVRLRSGAGWPEIASEMKRDLAPPEAGTGSLAPRPTPPQSFLDVLKWPALQPTTGPSAQDAPAPKPLRIVVWGQTPAKAEVEASELAAWSPSEAVWRLADKTDLAVFKRIGFTPPCWAVFRDENTVLNGALGAPDPARVAAALALNGSSRLQRLDAFIQQHPDHEDARRDRWDLLRARKPQPALESRLIEDAIRAWIPLDFPPDDPWVQHAAPWQQAAKRFRSEVESALRRWPRDPLLWRIWVSWRPFMAEDKSILPSTLAFAEGLPVFGSMDLWRASLPKQVHEAIAKECLETRHFQAMLDWFQSAANGLPPKFDMNGNNSGAQPPQEATIREGLGAALRALGRSDALVRIER